MVRIVLAILLSADCGPELDDPVSNGTMQFINIMFFALGFSGLLAAAGLWMERWWGYAGIMKLSVVTIAFDIWAVIFVQSSAAMGILLPTVFIAYLAWIRCDFFRGDGQ